MVKNPPANAGTIEATGSIPGLRKWQPAQIFLPGKFHRKRSLASYSPRGCKESDVTEQLNTHACMHARTYDIEILPNWSLEESSHYKLAFQDCIGLMKY